MFTGLIQALGTIRAKEPRGEAVRLLVEAADPAAEAAIGDSVAVNGCCLTVVGVEGENLAFDVIPESLDRTNLGAQGVGSRVNLELPLRPSDRLGGHFVQGHVDAVGALLDKQEADGDVRYRFSLPDSLRGQVVEKGSVAIDGISLTVADVDAEGFSVALIPHTLEVTTLGRIGVGDPVNLEGDILAKYVAAMHEARA
ncbi:MAG: riboflavin synthase [Planctomycetota bacterium]|jgi:riboflavin synthase